MRCTPPCHACMIISHLPLLWYPFTMLQAKEDNLSDSAAIASLAKLVFKEQLYPEPSILHGAALQLAKVDSMQALNDKLKDKTGKAGLQLLKAATTKVR